MRPNKHFFILISCWFLVNGFIFYMLGIKYAIDTTRFDAEAEMWLHGQFEPSYRLWYSGYIAFLVICKSIFHSIYASIAIQYILSLISTIFFYQGLVKLIKKEQPALYATLLVVFFTRIQLWNTCLLTESIFISLILLFVWAFSIEKKSFRLFWMISIAVLAATVRPNGGIILLTCCGVYAIQSIQQKKKLPVFFTIGAVIVLLIMHFYTETFYLFLLDSFNKGEIICGYSYWVSSHETYIINNPADGSLTKIIHLISLDPIKSVQLFLSRFFVLWADMRPYYKTGHNVYLGMYLFMAYTTAIIGFIQYRKEFSTLALGTLFYCGMNSALVMITYADWDGRFLAPLLPVVFVWSGLGIYFSIQFLKRKNTAL